MSLAGMRLAGMRRQAMRRWLGRAAAMLVLFATTPAFSLDCHSRLFTWSDTEPAINRRHVFCGEIDHGRPKGVHSTQLLATSAVVRRVEAARGDCNGIYTAIVVFAHGQRKLSTFFPDQCTVEDVTQSIYHAGSHVAARHPAWGFIGPSAPASNTPGFCLDADRQPFEIRFGRLKDGRINTAFPN